MNHLILMTVTASFIGTGTVTGSPVVMDWSTVGNAGNTPDPENGFGAVSYNYRISTYEVTNSQYAAFLNSVAASDPHGLYNPNMGTNSRGGIIRSGSKGSYTYAVRGNMGDKPVNYVSWYDAARMANWMTNGQGLHGSSGDTESGVYNFDGSDSIAAITRDLSNPDQVFIPTEDEWYKAAYHQPADQGGAAGDYWLYATQSNEVPAIAEAALNGDVSTPGQEVVNYAFGADWNGLNGNLTTVGSAESTSFYGAYDMNGNVWEWNETLIDQSSSRGLRGGSYNGTAEVLQSQTRSLNDPVAEISFYGFRLASPAPNCPADVDGSGTVDLGDLNAVLANFGQTTSEGDTNGDGVVNLADLNAVLAAFGQVCP
ncbi:MAG: SUMF1/EgtB/PvdO family nonheme iron enzyme [Phycisphaerales bacterium JB065]